MRRGGDEPVAADNELVAPDDDYANLRAAGPPSSQIDVIVVCSYGFVVGAYVVFVGGNVFVVGGAGWPQRTTPQRSRLR